MTRPCEYGNQTVMCGLPSTRLYGAVPLCESHYQAVEKLMEKTPGARFPRAGDGVSTPAKEAIATTPETAGGKAKARRAGSGAPTSRHSPTPRLMPPGKLRTPPSVPQFDKHNGKLRTVVEMIRLLGPAEIISAKHQYRLDVGEWHMVRYEPATGQVMDGTMETYHLSEGVTNATD